MNTRAFGAVAGTLVAAVLCIGCEGHGHRRNHVVHGDTPPVTHILVEEDYHPPPGQHNTLEVFVTDGIGIPAAGMAVDIYIATIPEIHMGALTDAGGAVGFGFQAPPDTLVSIAVDTGANTIFADAFTRAGHPDMRVDVDGV